ncbi:hypothetical protein LB579_28565 [Mesorhizobium sp. BR1-1-7]|uniref:hypothetical protein n=1 Tax=Mesorhizobium sp. BR1-1-7 TaxID=2876647 RepID=UPI001CCF2233|nr:hypothetical protein [Mesorhizobium sp. BR1-1-7]MBZ9921654.1 hypothetical protein [Mesorhizobium sp. BR1-1-7]
MAARGNVAFPYLDAFDEDETGVAGLKVRCRREGLGDMAVKHRLEPLLQDFHAPIRGAPHNLCQCCGILA